jgi:hypothetical protein
MTPPRLLFSTGLALLIGADVHVDWISHAATTNA